MTLYIINLLISHMRKLFLVIFLILMLFSSSQSYAHQTVSNIEYPDSLNEKYYTTIDVYLDPNLDYDNILKVINSINGSSFSSINEYYFNSTNILIFNLKLIQNSQKQSIMDYLKIIESSNEMNGHSFNKTAFEEGDSNVYTNITGISYDAHLTLEWISNNFWDGITNKHSLYLFDFSDMHPNENHWFTIKPTDIDTNQFQTGFFSGTKGLVNGKSVSAWGGHKNQPIHFIDFSSELWFGDFINTAWGPYGYSDTLLSSKIQDFTDEDDKYLWIGDYLTSFTSTTYNNQIFWGSQIGQSVKVQSIILFDWYSYGYDISDSKWLLGVEETLNGFQESFDWLDFNVTEQWYNLSAYQELQKQMDSSKYKNEDGQTYIELNNGLFDYIAGTFIPDNFDFEDEDIILPSLVFFLNNSIFTIGGLPIAGVSTGTFQLQGLNPERYYDDNGNKLRGFTDVILHEVGHSLGLPHPFNPNDGWVGDMTASVMGYYTSEPSFSQYDINSLGYYYSNHYLMQSKYLESEITLPQDQQYISDWLTQSINERDTWNFKSSIEYSLKVICSYSSITNNDDDRCDDVDIQAPNETSSGISNTSTNNSISTSNDSSNIDETSIDQLNYSLIPLVISLIILNKFTKNRLNF